MRYLKRFNESVNELVSIRKTCEEILLPLVDDDIRVGLWSYEGGDSDYNKDAIRIEIGDAYQFILLKKFESEIDHLLDYLNDEGFKLITYNAKSRVDGSYVVNEYWEDNMVCPSCYSDEVYMSDESNEWNDGLYMCDKCGYVETLGSFSSPRHPIHEREFKDLVIIQEVQFVSLLFGKTK